MVRFKSRYLLCEINVLDRNSLLLLNDRVVADAVKDAVARIHGDYGTAMCTMRFCVKYLNTYTGMVFLRFPKMCYELLWSALPFITSIETHRQKIPCFLNCLHIGGTMRTCQKFLIRYNTRQLHRMLPNCKNEEEKQQIRKAILSCSLVQEGFEDEPDDAVDADDDEV
ncbi:ribonuclease P/MRP protein subunit POP5 isoform X1 [Corythoichthys intestinalis]|uniref:ribonuclease P/MRP protein subunit POP5 isoform X1 n=1 Tax=Corythoichthys intestinalis TaxID=161448 RepID=UPI0025A63DE5|nr:ribonuclease P/MRP protein subunit POP5 isoform X1 [Corythoichthys intestinalis]XP_061804430.1 ribonuclease P/MRP protein subunit POP5-like [Nerophis lumbriciformis]